MVGSLLTTSTTPPFLFRTASHIAHGVKVKDRSQLRVRDIKDTVSRGINTTDLIDPLDGYGVEYHSSLAEIESLGNIKHMLKNHIGYENKVASEFSSWSVSLLYVLVHAVRKMNNERNGLLIYAMDTSKLSAAKLFCARDLLKKYDLQATPNLMEYALGEYLVHGRLSNENNLWKAVSLQALITAGLWDSFPELNVDQKTDLLKARVGQLRRYFFYTKPKDTPTWHLESLYSLAKHFDKSFEGAVTMALVAFRRRNLSPDLMVDLAHDLDCLQIGLPQLPLFCAVYLVVHDIPEVCQMYRMLRLLNEKEASLHAACTNNSSDQITESQSSQCALQDESQERFSYTQPRWDGGW